MNAFVPLVDGCVGRPPVRAKKYSGRTPRKTRIPTVV